MKNPFTQNSLKRKNHKQETKQENKTNDTKTKRVDTILDTVETEDIANMLRFILREEEIDKELEEQ